MLTYVLMGILVRDRAAIQTARLNGGDDRHSASRLRAAT